MDFPYGEAVRLLKRGSIAVEDPYSGEPATSPTTETVDITVPVPVFPGTTAEDGSSEDPYRVSVHVTAYLPYGTAVTEHDKLEVRTGPLAGVYAILGQPQPWKNPFTGWAPCTVVDLEVIRGA